MNKIFMVLLITALSATSCNDKKKGKMVKGLSKNQIDSLKSATEELNEINTTLEKDIKELEELLENLEN